MMNLLKIKIIATYSLKRSKDILKSILVCLISVSLVTMSIPQNVDAAVISKTIQRPSNNLGLVAYWTFDGRYTATTTSGVLDISGNGKNGSMVGTQGGTTTTQSFTSTSSWIAPLGLTSVLVEARGGGGAGGGRTSDGGGGGGHGGDYAKTVVTVSPGTSYTVTVGAQVNGGTGNGTAGNPSWFSGTGVVCAGGGTGGSGGSGTSGGTTGSQGCTTTGGTTKIGGNGGNGGSTGVGGGGGGGGAGDANNGTGGGAGSAGPTGGSIGTGGVSGGGDGSVGSANSASNAGAGTAPGGGGGGAYRSGTNRSGGVGARGQIDLTWTNPRIMPDFVSARVGQGLYFSGFFGGYISMGDVYNGVQTVAFWLKLATSTTQSILNLNGGNASVSVSSGTLSAGADFSSPTIYVDGSVSSTINDTNWHHVVITTGTGVNASSVDLGRSGSTYLGGSLDDVRLYNRAFTASDVSDIYHVGATSKISVTLKGPDNLRNSLAGWWTMDGIDTISTVNDLSGQGNDATYLLPITLDNASTTIDRDGNSTATLTFPQGKLYNGYVTVNISADNCGTTRTVSTVTYDGTTMTPLGSVSLVAAPGYTTAVWGLAVGNKSKGSYSANVTLSGTCATGDIGVAVVSYSGVDQTTSVGTTVATQGCCSETSASVDVSTSPGDLAVDIIAYPGTVTVDSSQTKIFERTDLDGGDGMSGSNESATGSSVNMSWTINNGAYLIVVTPLKLAYSINGLVKGTAGRIGQALDFDGVNNYVNIPDSSIFTLNSSGSYSWSAWIKSDNLTASSGFPAVWSQTLDSNNGFYIYAQTASHASLPGGSLTKGISAWWYTSGSSNEIITEAENVLTVGNWYHITVTYDGSLSQSSRLKIYVNGQDVTGSTTSAGTLASINPTDIRIGDDAPFSPERFDGSIDDVRFYTRALSSTEVGQLYHTGATAHISTSLIGGDALLNGLVGWWTFDGKNMLQNIADSSVNGYIGYLTHGANGTSTVPGKLGQALSFNGSSDCVEMSGTTIDAGAPFSYSVWIKPNSQTESYGNIGTYGNSGGFWYRGSAAGANAGKVSAYFTSDHMNNTALSDNIWNHYAAVFDGTNVYYYLNGQSNGSVAMSTPLWYLSRIGADSCTGFTEPFTGSLDDVRIYNRALSASEVQQLYNLGR